MPETSTASVLDDRYRLLAQLAVGGTSTVHLAEDIVLGRTVAIKVLHPHLAEDPTFLDRFRREALAAARVSHPHVVTLFDVAGDGTYLVMEHVDGPSLRDVLRLRGRLRPEEALALLGPAAAGLSAAHAKGLVHGDVKPENVLVNADGQVKIGDFGLSRAVATSSATFGPDVFAGSPHYTAPEAVRGHVLDARSDVYGLGVVLFECLTSRPPFEGETPFATAVAHTRERVPPPSRSAAGVPATLDEVVATATDPDPDRRYDTAAEFAAALHDAVPEGPATVDLRDGSRDTIVLPVDTTDTVVTARPASPPTHDRRRRWPWIVLVLALLAGGGGWYLYDQVLFPRTPLPGGLVGTTPDEASAQLTALGFEPRVADDAEHSLEVASGRVLEVSPTGEARKGSDVTLVLSDGPRQLEIPAVDGKEQPDAEAEIEDGDLVPVAVQEFSEQVPAGRVIRTQPDAGTIVDEASEVTVVVSKGREPIDVPSLEGQTRSEAFAAIEALGLQAEVVDEVFDEQIPEGAVVSQQTTATPVYRGDTVEVVVSRGPRPFALPDVESSTEEDARATLTELGLEVRVEYLNALFGFGAGRVGEQRPEAGTQVRRGDTVVLAVLR